MSNPIVVPLSGSLLGTVDLLFITGSIDVIYFPMNGGNEEMGVGDDHDNLIEG